MEHNQKQRTAAEAGWRLSEYNITAKLPEDDRWVIVNLMKGSCRAYSWAELIPLSMLDRIGEDSPLLIPFKKRGILVNYDEKAALPNFVYKPTGLEISWYKYPMRDAYSNQDVSVVEFAKILEDCKQSMKEITGCA